MPDNPNAVIEEQGRTGSFGAYKNYQNLLQMEDEVYTPRQTDGGIFKDYTLDESRLNANVTTSLPNGVDQLKKYESVQELPTKPFKPVHTTSLMAPTKGLSRTLSRPADDPQNPLYVQKRHSALALMKSDDKDLSRSEMGSGFFG